MPANRIALAIVTELGQPLVTTSVNHSGSNPLSDPYAIEDEFGAQLDLVVDGGILLGDPSTVISLVGDRIEVLRQGCGATAWITEG
jgi:tRNA A37 threonylcarbamoyladenosine synthetase subunit TsaC/SUA5/YrdC